jgi:hypothetical protein
MGVEALAVMLHLHIQWGRHIYQQDGVTWYHGFPLSSFTFYFYIFLVLDLVWNTILSWYLFLWALAIFLAA